MRTLVLAVIAAVALSSVADAKSCKDANGKFIKCPSAAAAQTGAKAMASAQSKSNDAMAGAKAKAAKADASAAKKDEAISKAATKKAVSEDKKAQAAAAKVPPKARTCTHGKPCGSACIPVNKVCHK